MRDTDVAGATRAWLLPSQESEGRRSSSNPATIDWIGRRDRRSAAEEVGRRCRSPPCRPSANTSRSTASSTSRRPTGASTCGWQRGSRPSAASSSAPATPRSPPFPKSRRCCASSAMARCCRCAASVASAWCRATCRNARLEIGRVLPEQLQHLAFSNEGSFAQPSCPASRPTTWSSARNCACSLPAEDPAKAHYEGVDLGRLPGAGAARRLPAQPAHLMSDDRREA